MNPIAPHEARTQVTPRRSSLMVLGSTAALIAVGLGVLFGLAALGWPGAPVDCTVTLCFCEATAAGPWRQPVNTWSNLAPLAAALAVAYDAGRPVNAPLRVLGRAYPVMLVFQGLGAMVFHASLLAWAGAVDAMSMFTIVGLLLGTNLLRAGKLRTQRQVLGLWLGLAAVGLLLGAVAPQTVAAVMFALFISVLASEVWLHARGLTVSSRWFRLGVWVFVAGVAVWFGSATEGAPLCSPASPWQGHALWHVTSGAAIALFWVHARVNLLHAARRRAQMSLR